MGRWRGQQGEHSISSREGVVIFPTFKNIPGRWELPHGHAAIGNQKHYQANAASPLFSELRGIVLKTIGLAEPLRAALKPLSSAIRAALPLTTRGTVNRVAASNRRSRYLRSTADTEVLWYMPWPSTQKSGRGPARRIVVNTREKPLGVIKQALTEEAIVALERPDGPAPNWLTPVVTSNSGGGVDLYPHSLYWGTRRTLESLFSDRALMHQTVEWFAPLAAGKASPGGVG